MPTIKRWSKAGAPFDNAKAMSEWIATKGKSKVKGMPTPTKPTPGKAAPVVASPEASPSLFTPPSEVVVSAGSKTGAPEALKRLQIEEMEQKAALDHGKRRMHAIREEVEKLLDKLSALPDPETTEYRTLANKVVARQKMLNEAEATYATWSKTALELWLKTAEQMRKFEKEVDESKRASGEVVPRAEAEQAMAMAAHWLRIATIKYVQGHGSKLRNQTDEAKIQGMILEGISDSLEAQLTNAARVKSKLKPWAIKAITGGFTQ